MSSNVFSSESTTRSRRFGGDGVVREKDTYVEKDYEVDQCGRPRCAPKCAPKPACPPPPCDPCKKSWWWLWSGIVLFIVIGVGLWLIKPSWVLTKDLAGNVALPFTIDWLKLVIYDLIITFLLVVVAWIIRTLAYSGGYGSYW